MLNSAMQMYTFICNKNGEQALSCDFNFFVCIVKFKHD